MPYQIEFLQEARVEWRLVPAHLRPRLQRLIQSLAHTPQPPKSKELRDEPGLYRVALAGWRVVYRVDDEAQTVLIVAVRSKKGPQTYWNLPHS
jgi:mRNA-degrading endonuclease RelE of RelBE toxin-antitoxin system